MVMRIALLADVHANLLALEAVLDDLERQGGADFFWFLGDAVGYNYDPRHCLQRLDDLVALDQPWLAGNHELGVRMLEADPGRNDPLLRDLIGDHGAFDVAQRHAGELWYLQDTSWHRRISAAPCWAMPLPDVAVAHGSILKPDAEAAANVIGDSSYVWEPSQARTAWMNLRGVPDGQHCRLLCVGHTHVQRLMWTARETLDDWDEVNPLKAGSADEPCEIVVDLPAARQAVMCPGSVGQPRDNDPRAGYALLTWDAGARSIAFRRVPYPVKAVQEKMRDLIYPKPLIDRLGFGI
jgi:predicted phosphodiesterase